MYTSRQTCHISMLSQSRTYILGGNWLESDKGHDQLPLTHGYLAVHIHNFFRISSSRHVVQGLSAVHMYS